MIASGTYIGGYCDSDSTSSDEWEPNAVVVHGSSSGYTANTIAFDAGLAAALIAVREFEQDVAEKEEIEELPNRPWLGNRPPRQPKRAFSRRPCSTRRRRRTELARRQKAVRPP